MSIVLEIADNLEAKIRKFLAENEDGGLFILTDCDIRELVVPLMIYTFEDEGWDVEYDYNTKSEWLQFKKLSFYPSLAAESPYGETASHVQMSDQRERDLPFRVVDECRT